MVPTNITGCSVHDVVRLFKSNKLLADQATLISANINAYHNRQTLNRSRIDHDVKRQSVPVTEGYTSAPMGLHHKHFHLYCVNIRATNRDVFPTLAIRQLSNHDNLFQIEEANRRLQETKWN